MPRSKASPPKQKTNHGVPQVILERAGFLLNKAAQRIREATEGALKSFGLTGRHLGVLAVIHEKGSLLQWEIGRCIHVDRTTMVQIVDDLEKLGLVERRANPSDRRAHALSLTGKGREVLPKAMRLGLDVERKFLSCLPEKDQRDLARILKHLVLTHYAPSKKS